MSALGWRIRKCKHGYLKSVRNGRICRKRPKSHKRRGSSSRAITRRASSSPSSTGPYPRLVRTVRSPITSLVRDDPSSIIPYRPTPPATTPWAVIIVAGVIMGILVFGGPKTPPNP